MLATKYILLLPVLGVLYFISVACLVSVLKSRYVNKTEKLPVLFLSILTYVFSFYLLLRKVFGD